MLDGPGIPTLAFRRPAIICSRRRAAASRSSTTVLDGSVARDVSYFRTDSTVLVRGAVTAPLWNSETNADGSIAWEARSLPVDGTLYDVADATAGPCAVGDGGVVLGRSADGSWRVLVENGPAARGETVHAADTTDDGARVWFGGSGGAVGYYDVPTGDRIDS